MTINSPLPQYLTKIFDSNQVKFSPRWSYLYLSEEGKKLFGSFQSNPFEAIKESDENVPENIVLAVGENDNVIVPSNWMNLSESLSLHKLSSILLKISNLLE